MLNKDAILSSTSFSGVFGGHLKKLQSVVKQWPGYEKIAEKLLKFQEKFIENLIKCGEQRPGEFAVLNHGDFWVNNMMFKYNEAGEPIDCVFVDMQMNIYSSPGLDLNYFFNTSLPVDTLINKREYLIEVYYDSLKDTLKSLHYETIPSYETVLNEVAAREDHGFFAGFAIFPTVAMDKSHSKDMTLESLMDEELGQKQREAIFSGKRLQEQMKYSLKRFDELGVFGD
uniref:CHK kinase-like domain-containing protein n=1 Tax=Megaselia scalaris TaxID=36166 RepID=T1GZ73_MEGSC